MPHSAFLAKHLTALPHTPAAPMGLGLAPAAAVVEFYPNFPADAQAQSNWCWAAVTTGILHHYGKHLSKSQCEIVGLAFGGITACPPSAHPQNNVPVGIDQALLAFGVFRGSANANPPDFQSEIVGELSIGQPLVAQYHFGPGRPDHVVVISGYEFGPEGNYIRVDDPAPIDVGSRAIWEYGDFFAANPVAEIFRTTP